MVKIMLQNSVPFSFIYGNPLLLKLFGPQSPKQIGDIVRGHETRTIIHGVPSNSRQRQGGAEEGRPVLIQPQGHSTKRFSSTFFFQLPKFGHDPHAFRQMQTHHKILPAQHLA